MEGIPQCYNGRYTILRGCAIVMFLFLYYAFCLVITRCFLVYLDSISMSCHCDVDTLNTEYILPFPLDHLLLSFIQTVNNSLLTQKKSCHTNLYSYLLVLPNLETDILEFSFDCSFMRLDLKCLVHHNFHCSLRFIFPDSHRYCRNEASFCSAGEVS